MSESKAVGRNSRRFQTGVRTLIVLVASCGVTFWAARSLWESQHPVYDAVRGLRDRSPSGRVNATRLLVRLGLQDAAIAIPPLTAALADPAVEVRVAACEALRSLVSEAVTAGSSAEAVRIAITALIGSLQDPKPDVRVAAARALEYIESSRGSAGVTEREGMFDALSRMFDDRDEGVRIAALDALGSTARKLSKGPPAALAARLSDESAVVRMAAIKALTRFPRDLDSVMPRIFEILELEDNSSLRNTSTNALISLRPPAFSKGSVPSLIKGLDSRHVDVRQCACNLLGWLGSDAVAAIPKLIKAMSDPIDPTLGGPGKIHPVVWDPAWSTVMALGKIAPSTPLAGPVIQALTEIVRTGHPYRRVAAAQALADFGPAAAGAVPVLIQVVRENVATKGTFGDGAAAATALGLIAPGTPSAGEAVACLTEALGAQSEYTRQEAAGALVRFGPKAGSSISRLRALVNDPDASVRSAATKALSALGDTE
jgi:HEAT repeat protein